MPVRRFRRSFKRGGRPRTRWLAIVPGSLAGGASASFNAAQLFLQDSAGAVSTADFVGGTLLKVILDVEAAVTVGAGNSGNCYSHLGVAVVYDDTPTAVHWDPNNPHGNFMERIYASTNTRLYGVGNVLTEVHNPAWPNMHFETKVRRRLQEDPRIMLFLKHFIAGNVTGVDYGYSGRVLIQLP